MEIKILGIHTTTKRLSSGVIRVYAYATRNGPFLCSADGANVAEAYRELRRRLASADMLAQLQVRTSSGSHAKTIETLFVGYIQSPEFAKLRRPTKRDYLLYLEPFRTEFGHYSLKLLERSPEAAADFLDWRDKKWKGKPASMDHFVRSCSALFEWGRMRKLTATNPFYKVEKVYQSNRAERIFSDEQLEKLAAAASPEVRQITLFASETALRQRDLLTLKWSDLRLDAEVPHLIRRTSKTNRQIVVPLTEKAMSILAEAPKRALTVFTSSRGEEWTADGFRSSFGRAMKRAGIEGLDFHDLRGTAITRLVQLDIEASELARIVGWSLASVEALLAVYVSAAKRDIDMLVRIKQKRDSTNREQTAG